MSNPISNSELNPFMSQPFNETDGVYGQGRSGDTADTGFPSTEQQNSGLVTHADFLFPGGLAKALVLSMDDGPVQDRRLIKLLGHHGVRGTFHLSSGRFGHPDYVDPEEVVSLYAGHEVSTHSVSHPYLDSLSRTEIAAEVGDDRAALSQLLGQNVRGHAYPFGAHNATVTEVLDELGIVYARTADQTRGFCLPADLLAWNPSCHHSAAGELAEAFLASPDHSLALLFIYGHSWELDSGEPTNSWSYMETLMQRLGGRSNIWYATAIDVADYVRAICTVQPACVGNGLYNPSGIDLWLRSGQTSVRLPTGMSVARHRASD